MVSEDPRVWESDIAGFEQRDRRSPPAEGAVVFVGSSSIRYWSDLAEFMRPVPVIQRGFGGAKINDVVHYADRIITTYKPRAVVVFVGTNDFLDRLGNTPKSPEQVMVGFRGLVHRIRLACPDTLVYTIAIKPTSGRDWSGGISQRFNDMMEACCSEEPLLHFIDANEHLVNADGSANREHLKYDGIHLKPGSYAIWGEPIKARLMVDLGYASPCQ